MSLRCAVVGTGHLGRFHAQKYAQLKDIEFVGVCDLNEESAKKVAAELNTQYFTDPKQLLGKVDAVTVAASTRAHYALVKLFLENGIHVHVEKPITVTSQEGEELCRLADSKNLKLQVGHVERFNPAFIAAREKMGAPLFIECHRLAPFKPRSMDVDVVLDLMIHDLDVILSLVKSDPVSVSGVGTPVLTSHVDIANARIEFESGAVANVTASRVSQNSQRKFRVFQDKQYLSLDFQSGDIHLLTKTGEWSEGSIPLESEAWNLEKADALLAETQAFVNAVKNNTPCVVTGWDGVRALKLAEAVMDGINKRNEKKNLSRSR